MAEAKKYGLIYNRMSEATHQVGHLISILYWLGLRKPQVNEIVERVISMMQDRIAGEKEEASNIGPPPGPGSEA